jgi:hypothetical protein
MSEKNIILLILSVFVFMGCSKTVYIEKQPVEKVCELLGSDAVLVVNDENYTCSVTINQITYNYTIIEEVKEDKDKDKDKDKYKDKDKDKDKNND